MRVSAYWAGCDNFGDKLTEALFQNMGGEVYFDGLEYAKICGAGSILNRFVTVRAKSYNYPLYVFGTGFDSRKAVIGTFNRKLKIYAIRGEYTKKYIEKIEGRPLSNNIVLGDIGLLATKLAPKRRVEKKYDLGIIPHYIDEEDIRFRELADRNPRSVILSVREEPTEFIRRLLECEYVISTALHPLIACDALRIPNMWAYLPDANQVDMSNKFNDYYSVFGKEKEPFVLDGQGLQKDLISLIEQNYDITDEMIAVKIRELEKAFNHMLEDIACDRGKDVFWRYISMGNKRVKTYGRILKKYADREWGNVVSWK